MRLTSKQLAALQYAREDRTDALMCIVWPATLLAFLSLAASDAATEIADRLRGRR